jgi:hypothetical protein
MTNCSSNYSLVICFYLKQTSDAKPAIADLPGDRQILNKLITRNIWLQTANILYELNFIQEAKEMLQEILNQAKVRLYGCVRKKIKSLLNRLMMIKQLKVVLIFFWVKLLYMNNVLIKLLN